MRPLFLTAILALGVAMPAQAEPAGTLVVQGSRALNESVRAVSYADLQLGSQQGRAELHKRVAFAIAEICDASRFSVAEPHDALKCRAETWAATSPRLEQLSPRLAAR